MVVIEVRTFISTVLCALALVALSACGVSSRGSVTQNQSQPVETNPTTSPSTDAAGQATDQPKSPSSPTDTTGQVTNRPQGAWVDTFEQLLYKGYHVTPSRYLFIGNGRWEVWVKEYDTGELPYVTVDQNTGDFHG
jgi:beta-lactamase class A